MLQSIAAKYGYSNPNMELLLESFWNWSFKCNFQWSYNIGAFFSNSPFPIGGLGGFKPGLGKG